MTAVTRWLAKAPRDPSERRLLAVSFADALGTGLFLPLSVIYLTRIVGLSPTRVGLGLTIAGFLAITATPISGALLGRLDARWVVLGCFGASAFGFLAYIAVDSFASFLGVAIVVQFASRMERPATAVLALGVTPRPRQIVALAWQYSLRNLGYGEWFLSVELAPARLRERYLSVFKTSMAVQQAVGPLLVTTVLVGWGRLGWFALALLLAAGTLASRRLGARTIAHRACDTPGTPLRSGARTAADRASRNIVT